MCCFTPLTQVEGEWAVVKYRLTIALPSDAKQAMLYGLKKKVLQFSFREVLVVAVLVVVVYQYAQMCASLSQYVCLTYKVGSLLNASEHTHTRTHAHTKRERQRQREKGGRGALI